MRKRVLVPMDNSSPAWEALFYALSEYPNEDILVIHVISTSNFFKQLGNLGEAEDDIWIEGQKIKVNQWLTEVKETAQDRGIDIVTDIESGNPPRDILKYAQTENVDQIIIGNHSRTGLERIFKGSTSEIVVRRSSIPVTVVSG